MGKRVDLVINFKAIYVPLSLEMMEARRASLLLLWQWIRDEVINEVVDGDREGNDGSGGLMRKRRSAAGYARDEQVCVVSRKL